ncbi:MAG TPA: GNAT family N-acetyltransferase [Sphingobacteriaceae bacterium]
MSFSNNIPQNSSIVGLSAHDDIDKVVDIWLLASASAHGFIDVSYWQQNVRAMKETYIPSAETWVCKTADDEISGFISLVDNCLASIFVHPDMQGKGIGVLLLAKAKQLRDELTLTVYEQNVNAVNFYKKHGFEVVKLQTDAGTGEQELVMTWKRDSAQGPSILLRDIPGSAP